MLCRKRSWIFWLVALSRTEPGRVKLMKTSGIAAFLEALQLDSRLSKTNLKSNKWHIVFAGMMLSDGVFYLFIRNSDAQIDSHRPVTAGRWGSAKTVGQFVMRLSKPLHLRRTTVKELNLG